MARSWSEGEAPANRWTMAPPGPWSIARARRKRLRGASESSAGRHLGRLAAVAALMPGSASAATATGGHEVVGYLVAALLVVGPLLVYAVLRDAARRRDAPPERAAEAAAEPEVENAQPFPDLDRLEAECWLELGDERLLDGEQVLAEAAYRHALREFEVLGDPTGEGEALRRLGHMARCGGEPERCRQLLERACGRFRAAGDRYAEASTLLDLGDIAGDLEDEAAARTAFATAGELLRGVLGDLISKEGMA